MEKKHLVSIIIVNWDSKKFITECINSLLKIKTKYRFEIIVVDNGSRDESIKYIKDQRSKIKNLYLIENKKNLGFAKGNNQGVELSRGDLILFLNNDTKVTQGFLDPLVGALLLDERMAGVQPKILGMDDPSMMDSCGSFFTITGILYHKGHQQKVKPHMYNKPCEIFSMKGACMLFKKSVLDKVGVFDQDYFAYFEETDLCHRIWLSGYKIGYVPDSVIFHKGGGSTGKVGQAFIQYHSFKNRIASYLTNFELGTLIWLLPVHSTLCLTASIGFVLIGKVLHAVNIYKAIFWNVSHVSSTFSKRRYVQSKLRRIKDSEYLWKVTRTVSPLYFWYLIAGGLEKMEEDER